MQAANFTKLITIFLDRLKYSLNNIIEILYICKAGKNFILYSIKLLNFWSLFCSMD